MEEYPGNISMTDQTEVFFLESYFFLGVLKGTEFEEHTQVRKLTQKKGDERIKETTESKLHGGISRKHIYDRPNSNAQGRIHSVPLESIRSKT
eukprot:488467-Amphidinium_carterae.1